MSNLNTQIDDIDKLFEQHNVTEIEQIHRLLEKQVEEKKQEVREIVGEKYRDLLETADTIIQMQTTAASLVDHMKLASNKCNVLSETQLFGFKTERKLDKNVEKNMDLYFTTNIRLRILTLLADLVWENINHNKFFIAAQIHVLSKHIMTSLELESDNKFLPYFSMSFQIFEMCNMAEKSLNNHLIERLEADDLTADNVVDYILCAYTLDESKIDKLVSSFLERRIVAFQRSFLNEDADKRVKDRILSSLKVLISTTDLVNQCFLSNENEICLFMKKIREHNEHNQQPTIEYVVFDANEWLEFLPASIRNFRPSIKDPILNNSVIEEVCSNWFKTVSNIAESDLRNLVNLVTSMKVIHEIKNEGSNLEKETNKNHQLKPFINFYKDIYTPLINDRIINIMTQSFKECIEKTFEKIIKAIDEPQSHTEHEYLWLENYDDLPKSLNDAFNQDKKENHILMKVKGYNSQILTICKYFDEYVKEILFETKVLLDDCNREVETRTVLIECLKTVTEGQVNDLLTKLKGYIVEKNTKTIVFIAKLLIGLTELCPNLKACLTFTNFSSIQPATSTLNKIWTSISGEKKQQGKWTSVCNLIEDETFSMWKRCCDLLFLEFLENHKLSDKLGYRTILEDFVNWETITIEEKDEQDKTVTSTLRLPSQPRISIHKFLFELITTLNELIPQSLPINVLRYLITKLNNYFIELYGKLIDNKFTSTNQNMALQLFFDLKLIQAIFTTREDRTTTDNLQKLTNTLKGYIDPFDFELFYSPLHNNVKKCVYRMQHQFGILIPYPENVNLLIADLKGSSNLLEKDPNVLILSSSSTSAIWFPLLPVMMENKTEAPIKIEKPPSRNPSPTPEIDESKQTVQNYTSNVKSGAAAFFGAMSQDWFR